MKFYPLGKPMRNGSVDPNAFRQGFIQGERDRRADIFSDSVWALTKGSKYNREYACGYRAGWKIKNEEIP